MGNNDYGRIMHSNEQKIKAITNDFYERLSLFDVDSFVHGISSLSKHLDYTFQSLLNQFDSRIFFGDKIESLNFEEYEYNTFNVMKVIALVTEELKRNQNNINQLQEIVISTTNRSDVPNWLKERLITYIPPLLFKKYSKELRNQSSSTKKEMYKVFLCGKIKSMDKAELDSFMRKNTPDNFDMFIENTDYVSIHIKGNSKIFRAGNYHPFNILSLFLQRLGKSLTYREIYHLAIKPFETTPPRDHSKKVYDYVKTIKRTINESEEIDIDPDEWFKRDHNKGIIHVSESIKSCLITTDQDLFI